MSAEDLLRSLIGQTLETATGRNNRILGVADDHAVVQTDRSPAGRPVPVAWVQAALEELYADGSVTINVESVGYRSAFIGAVLRTVPGAVLAGSPPVVRLSDRPVGSAASRV